MYLLYSVFLVTWGILLIPGLLYRAWRQRKYLPGLSQRLGRLPETLKSNGYPTIWFHACSVGETLSLQPLIESLRPQYPQARFVFSTITQTGQLIAARSFEAYGPGNTFYFPIDLASVIKRVLNWIRPALIVIVDTEIWPNLVHQAHRRKIPIILANGRISAASFPYYRCARPVLARVLRKYRLLMMQSEEDARRISAIGAPSDKILVTGNIKFDRSQVEKADETIIGNLGPEFCQEKPGEPLIVAGSTHPGEELILLEVLQRIRQLPGLGNTRLLLAPRHPERFEDVAEIVVQKGFTLRKRTDPAQNGSGAEVLLLNTLGELAAAYRFATVAFVGGTLVHRGGHSIMEPALHAKAIVIGPSMENFRGIVEEFRKQGGIRQIDGPPEERSLQVEQLTQVFADLLQDAVMRETLGNKAFSLLERNRGAARLTADRIASTLKEVVQSAQFAAFR
jgi:3-deoxy-D-manno-octulosonic-acid transferase